MYCLQFSDDSHYTIFNHNDNYRITKILNDNNCKFKKILIRYIPSTESFEYYATDENLWYIQNKLCEDIFLLV